MPKRHSNETRAAAVAAVASGESLSDVARRFGISKGRLSDWCKRDLPAALALEERSGTPDPVPELVGTAGGVVRAYQRRAIAELVRDLVSASIRSLIAQSQVTSDPDWIREQTASGLAAYRGQESDRLLRFLPAFADEDSPAYRAADDDPDPPDALDAPARTADASVHE